MDFNELAACHKIHSLCSSNLSCFIVLVRSVKTKSKHQNLFLDKASISSWLVVSFESKVHLRHSGLLFVVGFVQHSHLLVFTEEMVACVRRVQQNHQSHRKVQIGTKWLR